MVNPIDELIENPIEAIQNIKQLDLRSGVHRSGFTIGFTIGIRKAPAIFRYTEA